MSGREFGRMRNLTCANVEKAASFDSSVELPVSVVKRSFDVRFLASPLTPELDSMSWIYEGIFISTQPLEAS